MGYQYEFKKSLYGGSPLLMDIQMGAAVTVAIGDLVELASGGYYGPFNATNALPAFVMAEAAAAVTAGTKRLAVPCLPGYVFVGFVSSAVTQAKHGTLVDVEGVATGTYQVDPAESTNDHIRLLGLADGQSNGVDAKVEFFFNKSIFAVTQAT